MMQNDALVNKTLLHSGKRKLSRKTNKDNCITNERCHYFQRYLAFGRAFVTCHQDNGSRSSGSQRHLGCVWDSFQYVRRCACLGSLSQRVNDLSFFLLNNGSGICNRFLMSPLLFYELTRRSLPALVPTKISFPKVTVCGSARPSGPPNATTP